MVSQQENEEEGKRPHSPLGFSAHVSLDVMKRFLAAYGEHMEFCQIQLTILIGRFRMQKRRWTY